MSRRKLLELVGLGAVSGAGLTASSLPVSAAETSSGDVLLDQDFEAISVGDYPSDWEKDGNESQRVIDDYASSGSKSLELRGAHGGCWQAVANAPLEFPTKGQLSLEFAFRPTTDGAFGCHSYRGTVSARTDAGWWGAGKAVGFVQFEPDGTVTAHGETVGDYEVDNWNRIDYSYTRESAGESITVDVTVNPVGSTESSSATIERSPTDFEDQLQYLCFRSGDFTTQLDDIKVTRGEVSQQSNAVIWPESIDYGPVVRGTSPVRPVLVANPASNDSSVEVEEINTSSNANLITGNAFTDISWLSADEPPTEVKPGEASIFGVQLANIDDTISQISGDIQGVISGIDFSLPFTGTSVTKADALNDLATTAENISDLFTAEHLEKQAIDSALSGVNSLQEAAFDRATQDYAGALSSMVDALRSFDSSINYSMVRDVMETIPLLTDVSGVSQYAQDYDSLSEKLSSAASEVENDNFSAAASEYRAAAQKATETSNKLKENDTASDLREHINQTYSVSVGGLSVNPKIIEREVEAFEEYLDKVSKVAEAFATLLDGLKPALVSANSPVDLKATTEEGHVVSKNTNEVAGATYLDTDVDNDGEREDLVAIPHTGSGISVDVIPEANASPSDTYSLGSIVGSRSALLADDVEVQNRPEDGYEASLESLIAEVDIDPNTLSKNAGGKFVTAYLQLPEGFGVRSQNKDVADFTVETNLQGRLSQTQRRSIVSLALLTKEHVAEASIELDEEGGDVKRDVEGYVSAAQQAAIDGVVSILESERISGSVSIEKEMDWDAFVSTVDISTVTLNDAVTAVSDDRYGFVKNIQLADRDGDGLPEMMVKFPREKVTDLLPTGNSVEVSITGEAESRVFAGSGRIKVIGKRSDRKSGGTQEEQSRTNRRGNNERSDRQDPRA